MAILVLPSGPGHRMRPADRWPRLPVPHGRSIRPLQLGFSPVMVGPRSADSGWRPKWTGFLSRHRTVRRRLQRDLRRRAPPPHLQLRGMMGRASTRAPAAEAAVSRLKRLRSVGPYGGHLWLYVVLGVAQCASV